MMYLCGIWIAYFAHDWRARIMAQPVEAVIFDRRKITFLMLPNMLLNELIAAE
jgi:hypothetical protein